MNYKFIRSYFAVFLPIVAVVLFFPFSAPSQGLATAVEKPKFVLVLYDNNRLLPANVEADRALNASLSASRIKTDVNAEFLDSPHFSGTNYAKTVAAFLRDKYSDQPPDIIVAAGDGALGFILDNRDKLFTGIPVVHMGVGMKYLQSRQPIPQDVVGIGVPYDFAQTIAQALSWLPNTSRLVVVTGASEPDRDWETDLRAITADYKNRIEVEFMSGLPTTELLHRVGNLKENSVIFTPGYFQDGDGRNFLPRDSAREVAVAANAPVFGPFNTFMGTGIVGGVMPNFAAMGEGAGGIVEMLLEGTKPETLALPSQTPQNLNVDWRQVQRWGIDQSKIPSDAVVLFKTPTFWENYSHELITVVLVFLLQSALVAFLLTERARRRKAETTVDKHRFELAHASRLAVAGQLTASIAHEINQPLGAILSNVSAAELMLASGGDHQDELKLILADIHRDNIRASEVIRRLRTLLSKHQVERKAIDVNEALADVIAILGAEAQRRGASLRIRTAAAPLEVLADRIQIQQVLINLIINAMDASTDVPEDRRIIAVTADRKGHTAAIAVSDRGCGISAEHLPKLFESFFSTKPAGIGLGLSIVRTLVVAQGGKVWGENAPEGGAILHVELPLAGDLVRAGIGGA